SGARDRIGSAPDFLRHSGPQAEHQATEVVEGDFVLDHHGRLPPEGSPVEVDGGSHIRHRERDRSDPLLENAATVTRHRAQPASATRTSQRSLGFRRPAIDPITTASPANTNAKGP